MCGLVTIVKKESDNKSSAEDILKMFSEQRLRGEEGFGYVAFEKELMSYVRRETYREIADVLGNNTCKSIMFHHRFPTSTPNLSDCAHPIHVSNKELKHDYYLIHNGVVSNCDLLKAEYNALGYDYTTEVTTTVKTENSIYSNSVFNDSESLAIDVARFIEGKQKVIKSRGSIAFIVLQVNKNNLEVKRVFWGRNTSPLGISFDDNKLVLRSQFEKESVKPNKMYCLDIAKWEINDDDVQIGEIGSSRNSFDFFNPREKDDERVIDITSDESPDSIPSPEEYSNYQVDDDYNLIKDMEQVDRLTKIRVIDETIAKLNADIYDMQDDIDSYMSDGLTHMADQIKKELDSAYIKLGKLEQDRDDLVQEGIENDKF